MLRYSQNVAIRTAGLVAKHWRLGQQPFWQVIDLSLKLAQSSFGQLPTRSDHFIRATLFKGRNPGFVPGFAFL